MSALAAIALNAGLPIVEKILSGKLGDARGQLATQVIRKVAEGAGVAPEALETAATETPGRVIDAMREVERSSPEVVALYAKGLEHQFTLLQAEMAEGGWKANWRPAGMWFTLFLWFYQIVGLHVANAIFKIALPPCDWQYLMTFTATYMGLYMGGHTVKDVVAKWTGAQK